MIKPIRHDKRTKNKKSRALLCNIAAHPFMLAAVIAAVALVVWALLFYGLHITQGERSRSTIATIKQVVIVQ